MNAPLRRLSIAVFVLFGLLLANINYLQIFKAESLRTNPRNPRIISEEYSRQRGPILVDGKPIARSVATQDRLKYLRTYPDGKLYAPVTGFYSLVYGSSAIESESNSVLAGTDAALFVRRVVDLLTGAQPQGGSVALTLDPAAQKAAYDGLTKLGARGAVVAINPTTGAILALVSTPSYDPNVVSSHDPTAVRAAYRKLSAAKGQPMLDRALRQTYPPGSTFKVVTAAAALESGRYTPDSEVDNAPSLDLPQTTSPLPNENGGPCNPAGAATLTIALENSCNVSFGKIGLDLGADALRAQADKFGFDTSVQIPMTSATSRFPENPDPPQTAQSAIGQFDVRATPLQMAMVAAAIANRGVLMAPYLVQEVRGPDLSVLDTTQPKSLGTAVSPQTAAQLSTMMTKVVQQGTGTNGQIANVAVAGKTGTAQQGGGRPPHAWFISFAPADTDPLVAVAVVVEDGGGSAEISGNGLAAPIARAVMQAVLSHR